MVIVQCSPASLDVTPHHQLQHTCSACFKICQTTFVSILFKSLLSHAGQLFWHHEGHVTETRDFQLQTTQLLEASCLFSFKSILLCTSGKCQCIKQTACTLNLIYIVQYTWYLQLRISVQGLFKLKTRKPYYCSLTDPSPLPSCTHSQRQCQEQKGHAAGTPSCRSQRRGCRWCGALLLHNQETPWRDTAPPPPDLAMGARRPEIMHKWMSHHQVLWRVTPEIMHEWMSHHQVLQRVLGGLKLCTKVLPSGLAKRDRPEIMNKWMSHHLTLQRVPGGLKSCTDFSPPEYKPQINKPSPY